MILPGTRYDNELLVALAEYRLLSAQHLISLHRRNASALRRRLRQLASTGLIEQLQRPKEGRPGRPEVLATLTREGVSLLHARGLLDPSVSAETVVFSRRWCTEHELLINDLRVQLVQLESVMNALRIRFFASTSPFLPEDKDGRLLTRERVLLGRGGRDSVHFVPDGVFAIHHNDLGKTLLFFLEVDRGTEPLDSRKKRRQSVRQKISNYQLYLKLGAHKRYEFALSATLRGFRLLLLTTSTLRQTALCRLLREIPSSDFVWTTTKDRIRERGCWAPIWTVGGHSEEAAQSILGSQMPRPCPKPSGLCH